MEDEGLVVIGVTDEPPSLVDGWVKDVKAEFPIVSLKDGGFEDFLGVRFFPTVAVIDPEWKLAYSGSSAGYGDALDAALDRAERSPLFPKVFKKVTKSLREGEYGDAYDELLKLLEKEKLEGDEEVEVGGRLRAYLEGLAADALSGARELVEGKRVYEAVLLAEPFAEAEPAFPATPELAAFLEELEADPNYKREIAGGKKFLDAEEEENAGEFLDAFKAYRSIWKKYEGARVADLAHEKAKLILDEGRPGWEQHCDVCRQSRSYTACPKHREKVSL